MRIVLVTALFALVLNAGASLPAAAGASDTCARRISAIAVWSDDRIEARASPRGPRHDQRHRRGLRGEAAPALRGGRRRPAALHQAPACAACQARPAPSPPGQPLGAARWPHRSGTPRSAAPTIRPDRGAAAAPYRRPRWSDGMASYYWQAQRVASGARFNPEGMTAAHRTLPFGTRVRVTHLGNGRSVNVRHQ